ncbi:aldose epimerase family protein [Phyllobacterium sp. YR531]|uniref:aldose epimerase family protein n=1 Tax=Phyllobacterium sp. YR531 TaxID=1144343 RepID=UPI00026F6C52|nr:aldose epimerase family protein [Phyllobacterium sp. YR531]EJN06278.1 galactose mutarotase-like enzyme [Phyllobacterium sp. YR531]
MRALAAPQTFGTFEGQPVLQATILSPAGAVANILNWGAVIRDLKVPLKDGSLQRVVLGFDDFDSYLTKSPYFGALVGRYANRISNGQFTLGGKTVELDRNENGKQTLHGGSGGVSQKLWRIVDWNASSVTLGIHLPDGDQGFPGNMDVQCTYSFVGDATLRVSVEATSDATTIANFAQHSYFNLDGSSDVRDHDLRIFSEAYTPVDSDLIPTGEISLVAGTPFDFCKQRKIRSEQGITFDHNFVLSYPLNSGLRQAALLTGNNGLSMEIHTSEPGLQFYDGAMIPALRGLGGVHYDLHAGLCLEAQNFPDGPNQLNFPSGLLMPDEIYRQTTEFRFKAL